MNTKLLFGLTILVAALVFSLQNAEVVDVRFLAWKFSTSLALIVFSTLVAGAVGGWSIAGTLRLRKKLQQK